VTVAPHDVDALSVTIGELLANPDRRVALASRAQARAHAVLSLDRQAAMLDLLFRRIGRLTPSHHPDVAAPW
jgi:hypothetical protein